MNAILDEWEKSYSDKDARWLAYALATTLLETNSEMAPVEEGYYLGSETRIRKFQKSLRYYPFFGRGLVQLTWDYNYKKLGDVFGADLLKYPEKALDADLAVKIMFYGMEKGVFTGRKFADYFSPTLDKWVGARAIINGTDKANLIAVIGKKFYSAISYMN